MFSLENVLSSRHSYWIATEDKKLQHVGVLTFYFEKFKGLFGGFFGTDHTAKPLLEEALLCLIENEKDKSFLIKRTEQAAYKIGLLKTGESFDSKNLDAWFINRVNTAAQSRLAESSAVSNEDTSKEEQLKNRSIAILELATQGAKTSSKTERPSLVSQDLERTPSQNRISIEDQEEVVYESEVSKKAEENQPELLKSTNDIENERVSSEQKSKPDEGLNLVREVDEDDQAVNIPSVNQSTFEVPVLPPEGTKATQEAQSWSTTTKVIASMASAAALSIILGLGYRFLYSNQNTGNQEKDLKDSKALQDQTQRKISFLESEVLAHKIMGHMDDASILTYLNDLRRELRFEGRYEEADNYENLRIKLMDEKIAKRWQLLDREICPVDPRLLNSKKKERVDSDTETNNPQKTLSEGEMLRAQLELLEIEAKEGDIYAFDNYIKKATALNVSTSEIGEVQSTAYFAARKKLEQKFEESGVFNVTVSEKTGDMRYLAFSDYAKEQFFKSGEEFYGGSSKTFKPNSHYALACFEKNAREGHLSDMVFIETLGSKFFFNIESIRKEFALKNKDEILTRIQKGDYQASRHVRVNPFEEEVRKSFKSKTLEALGQLTGRDHKALFRHAMLIKEHTLEVAFVIFEHLALEGNFEAFQMLNSLPMNITHDLRSDFNDSKLGSLYYDQAVGLLKEGNNLEAVSRFYESAKRGHLASMRVINICLVTKEKYPEVRQKYREVMLERLLFSEYPQLKVIEWAKQGDLEAFESVQEEHAMEIIDQIEMDQIEQEFNKAIVETIKQLSPRTDWYDYGKSRLDDAEPIGMAALKEGVNQGKITYRQLVITVLDHQVSRHKKEIGSLHAEAMNMMEKEDYEGAYAVLEYGASYRDWACSYSLTMLNKAISSDILSLPRHNVIRSSLNFEAHTKDVEILFSVEDYLRNARLGKGATLVKPEKPSHQ